MTKVIFRKYKDGKIIAVFPEYPGDMYGNQMTTYSHIGQHGSGYWTVILRDTVRATEEEYKQLYRELENMGYENLVVYRGRVTSQMDAVRRERSKG